MEYSNLLGTSIKTVVRNFFPYAIATVILSVGSILFVTAPPLLYGFIMMLAKGTRNEVVKGMDILDGFRDGNFVRSWKYMLFVMISIVAMILLFFVGILSFGLMFTLGSSSSSIPESVILAIVAILYLAVLCIVLIPVFFMLYMLPLYVIKGYDITDALSESAAIVKANITASVIISLIVGLVALVGVLPYYAGLFLGWPVALNLLIYITGVLLTTPLSQQILVNTTFELVSFPFEKEQINE
jgi:hypothetical protein